MGVNVPANEENAKKCTCPTCPTYKGSQLTGTAFCATGKASKAVSQSGCICPGCPVFKQYGLNQMYYCQQGKSADL